jgi:Icc-related predicted phosphoesterase
MHEPPIDTALAVNYLATEAAFTRRIIESAQPDFSLHGHIHEAPTRDGGSWREQLGATLCFNAGQSRIGELPNFILLNWHTGEKPAAHWWGGERLDCRRSSEPGWE